jgi:hypothetical protein
VQASSEIYRQLKSDATLAQDSLTKANREIEVLRKARADDAAKIEVRHCNSVWLRLFSVVSWTSE